MRRLETSPRITPHYDAWSVELRPSTTVGIVGYTIPFVLKCVQQLCSNPGKPPEMLGKATTYKYGYLQEFCKLQEAPANYRAAFTRQSPLVRNQHRPLPEVLQMARNEGVHFAGPGGSRSNQSNSPERLRKRKLRVSRYSLGIL